MSREGQGFSLSLIVIAAIALVVMVILIALTTASGGKVFQQTQTCESLGSNSQSCEPAAFACPDGWTEQPSWSCEDAQEKCCQRIS